MGGHGDDMAIDGPSHGEAGSEHAANDAGELLLVGEEASTRLIAESLEADDHRCVCVSDVDAARRRVLEHRFDVVVLDLDALAGRAFDVVHLAARLSPSTLCILRSRTATVDAVVAAMRAGIGDYLLGSLSVPQWRLRVRAAIRRAREARERLDRVARLTSLCRSLVARRGDAPSDVEELAALMDGNDDQPASGVDMSPGDASSDDHGGRGEHAHHGEHAHDGDHGDHGDHGNHNDHGGRGDHDHHDHPANGTAAQGLATFDEAGSQHLDPEQLLTSAIEHLVAELGPLNIAVYLGTGSCRFGLAAYARADLPRASIEPALLRWSDEICTMAAADGGVQLLPEASILFTEPNDSPQTREELARRAAIVLPCKCEGACDAVFILLPPEGVRVKARLASELLGFGASFARQLTRIQRVHSRYRPAWPNESD